MFNKIVNAVLLVACCVATLSGGLYAYKFYQDAAVRSAIANAPHVAVGQIYHVADTGGKPSLILEVSPTCPHCIADREVYQQLSAAEEVRDGRVQVLTAILADDKLAKAAKDFVAGIPGTVMQHKDPKEFPFPFSSTPTLFLLDGTGKVVKTWVGELQARDIKDLKESLKANTVAVAKM